MNEFVTLCARDRIPMLWVQDTTGIDVGNDAERAELLGLGQSLIYSIQSSKLPMMEITLRKGTAAAHYVLGGPQGNDNNAFSIGTATTEIYVMHGETAAAAGNYEKARYYAKKLMKSAYLFMDGAIVLILALLPLIMRLYNVSDEAATYARQIIWMHGIAASVLWPASFTLPQALRAAGDTRFTMVVSTVSMWTLRVGLGILLGRYWGFGVLGIWMAMFADWMLRVSFFIPRFHGRKWESMGIRE